MLPYHEMILKYADFIVSAPGIGSREITKEFTGAHGESATYAALVRMEGAEVIQCTIRVNLPRAIGDLMHRRYSNQSDNLCSNTLVSGRSPLASYTNDRRI